MTAPDLAAALSALAEIRRLAQDWAATGESGSDQIPGDCMLIHEAGDRLLSLLPDDPAAIRAALPEETK